MALKVQTGNEGMHYFGDCFQFHKIVIACFASVVKRYIYKEIQCFEE